MAEVDFIAIGVLAMLDTRSGASQQISLALQKVQQSSALGASRPPFAMIAASRGLLDKHTLPPSASKSPHLSLLCSLL